MQVGIVCFCVDMFFERERWHVLACEACAELTNEQLTAFLAGRATAPSADVEMVDATA